MFNSRPTTASFLSWLDRCIGIVLKWVSAKLLQNAADAVLERSEYCKRYGVDPPRHLHESDECDVSIRFEEQSDGWWLFTIRDDGIGMTPSTIRDYFLRAGASYRRDQAWKSDFVDENGQPTVVRNGRFGIGVYAAFLRREHASANSALIRNHR